MTSKPHVDIIMNKTRITFPQRALIDSSPVFGALARWSAQKDILSLAFISKDDSVITIVLRSLTDGKFPVLPDRYLAEVLRVADMLFLDELAFYCKSLLQKIPLSPNNCFDILQLCSLYECCHESLNVYIRGNLRWLSNDPRIALLTFESLKNLLLDEKLTYWPANERHCLVTKWCKPIAERARKFGDLISLINLNKAIPLSHQKRGFQTVSSKIPILVFFDTSTKVSKLFGFCPEFREFYHIPFPDMLSGIHISLTVTESGEVLLLPLTDELSGCVFHVDLPKYHFRKLEIEHNENSLIFTEMIFVDGNLLFLSDKFLPFGENNRRRINPFQYIRTTIYTTSNWNTGVVHIKPLVSFSSQVKLLGKYKDMVYLLENQTKGKRVMVLSLTRLVVKEIEINDQTTVMSMIVLFSDMVLLISGQRVFKVVASRDFKHLDIKWLGTTGQKCIFASWKSLTFCLTDDVIRYKEKATDTDVVNCHTWNQITIPEQVRSSIYFVQTGIVLVNRNHPMCHFNCPHCRINANPVMKCDTDSEV